jgi:hypothetical protein
LRLLCWAATKVAYGGALARKLLSARGALARSRTWVTSTAH